LEGLEQETFGLPPMPKGSYAYVIKGPVQRLQGQPNALKMDDELVEALLTDIEAGVAGDVLPLLAFTLERLYQEYHASGVLKLEHYVALGQVKGSIEAAVEAAFKAANNDQNIPVAHQSRLELLRRGLIPHLASIDADTGAPVRKAGRVSDIPEASRPLLHLLVEQRLLSTDISMETGETTIEPVHEALLRQWSLLKGWLAEDALQLRLLEGVRRASRDWIARDRAVDWLIHRNERLAAAERLITNTDLTGALDLLDRDYLYACRKVERAAISRQRRLYTIIAGLALALSAGLVAWANRAVVESSAYRLINFWPYVLSAPKESRLNPLDTFRECATGCPEMVVVPPGQFLMGSEPNEPGREHDEGPKHNVVIPKRFAVSKFAITFDEWEACARHGPCAKEVRDYGWGRGRRPVISINWNDAKVYVRWLSTQTGKTYRLLSEAEWEYLARTGSNDSFDLSQFSGTGKANCKGCGSQWDSLKTAPVGSFPPNAWGLYDLQGNVWQWVEDCWESGYQNAPNDSMPVESADCARRVMRGGAWNFDIRGLRAASDTPIPRSAATPVLAFVLLGTCRTRRVRNRPGRCGIFNLKLCELLPRNPGLTPGLRLLDLGPRIAQRDGPVEHQLVPRGIAINAEVTQSFKLVSAFGRDAGQRGFDAARGDDLE
jgi:formylglycine-generating enzyme required for sulfatase activity